MSRKDNLTEMNFYLESFFKISSSLHYLLALSEKLLTVLTSFPLLAECCLLVHIHSFLWSDLCEKFIFCTNFKTQELGFFYVWVTVCFTFFLPQRLLDETFGSRKLAGEIFLLMLLPSLVFPSESICMFCRINCPCVFLL